MTVEYGVEMQIQNADIAIEYYRCVAPMLVL